MTVQEVAAKLGVAPVTIYRRLRKRGIEPDTLRAGGELTEEGAAVIASLFDDVHVQGKQALHGVSDDTLQDDASVRVHVLEAKLEAAEARVADLLEERTRLQAEVSSLLGMLRTEQEGRQQLLTDGNQRRGLLSWLRRR